jgi:hypothetical protein
MASSFVSFNFQGELERQKVIMSMEFLIRLFCRMKLYLAVILLQFGYAGMALIAKFALNQGMSHFVLIAYRMAIASLVIAPFAFVFERSRSLSLSLCNLHLP